jgi:hypothetical protein
MPKILSKRTSTQSSVPAPADLELGEIGINTYDGKMYIKRNDGTDAIIEIGGGSITLTTFTATSGQTVFTTNYAVGSLIFFREGVLIPPSEYTASNGTDITLNDPCQANDKIVIYKMTAVGVAVPDAALLNGQGPNYYLDYDNFTNVPTRVVTEITAGAGQTTFTANYDPNNVDVYLEGLMLASADYTATNGTSVDIPSAVQNDVVIIKSYA